MGPTLSEGQRAAMEYLIAAPVAWTKESALKRQRLYRAAQSLVTLGLVEVLGAEVSKLFGVPAIEPSYTLTAWGASVAGVHLEERWEFDTETEEQVAGYALDAGGAWITTTRRASVRMAVAVPRWSHAEPDAPLVQPSHARERPYHFNPDQIEAPEPEPEPEPDPAAPSLLSTLFRGMLAEVEGPLRGGLGRASRTG